MKLQYSPNSPYVRKVTLLAHELGLNERIERQPTTLSPYEPNPAVTELNPLGKIPVLITDEGEALFDSIVICEYLASVAGDRQWFPEAGPKRWAALRANAVADGMLEAAQLMRFESSRPEAVRYGKWIDAQGGKLQRSFAYLEGHLPDDDDIGAIAVAAAIGWLDFRFPQLQWRDAAPRLAAWYAAFDERASARATRHPA
jgi:glutathione S-transferase